jgi:hypothetical protein
MPSRSTTAARLLPSIFMVEDVAPNDPNAEIAYPLHGPRLPS